MLAPRSMKPPSFVYYRPTALDEAATLLHAHPDEAKLLAGGQSLVPLLNFRLARPSILVDLGRVPDLAYVREEDAVLLIGALTRQTDIELSDLVRARLPLLGAAVEEIGHPTIRNQGTIGGSIAHADPAAELACVLVTVSGWVRARSAEGERTIMAENLFQGYLQTALRPDEIIVEVALPTLAERRGWAFVEFSRRHGDFALAMVAVMLSLGEAGQITSVSIGLGGVAPTPVRARQAEALLCGQLPTDRVLRDAAVAIREATDAADDIHASAEDRRHLVSVLGRRALGQALDRARGGER